jgi:hypothetical protein
MRDLPIGRAKVVHPYAWLWEPFEGEASFVLRSMFGAKTAYLDGKLMLGFIAKRDPWRGLFVCTDRVHHAALQAQFPALAPHSVLGKWLYLPESADAFEPVAQRLVQLVRQRDPRFGVVPTPKKRRRT